MSYSGLSIFFKDAEETLFKQMGRELIETLIVQHFTLYQIEPGKTESNFYGESKHKVYKDPVEVIGRIKIQDMDIVSEGGVRRMAKGDMSAWIYLDHMNDLGIEINIGDFIKYEEKYYEVYDAGLSKDSLNRKFAGDRNYYKEILAKVVSPGVFKSNIESRR